MIEASGMSSPVSVQCGFDASDSSRISEWMPSLGPSDVNRAFSIGSEHGVSLAVVVRYVLASVVGGGSTSMRNRL